MWYVIQVRTGLEENVRLLCMRKISTDVLKEIFIIYYEEKKHISGEWKMQRKILFPGYVFLVSEEPKNLYKALKKVPSHTKLLGTGNEIVPLKEEEVNFLKALCEEKQVVPMSEGVIENSKVIVKSGPLVGREGYIRRIDRHKRKAYLEVTLFGRIQKVQVGLEIISKT